MPPDTCPNCGADVPPRAKFCPGCGSDETTGWSETAYASGLGLPDEEDFNHEEFVKEEFGGGRKPDGISWFWWLTALLLVLLLLFLFLR